MAKHNIRQIYTLHSQEWSLLTILSLNLNDIEPSRKSFEHPKTCAVKILGKEIEKFLQKDVLTKAEIKTCSYF